MRSTHPLPNAMAMAMVALAVLVLAGCASAPRGGRAPSPFGRDGPGSNPPADLALRPDAEPRIEPLRNGGPNKPYEVFGRWYTPLTSDAAFRERGLASWYGRKFHGRPTSSGEPYDMYAMTAAHRTMPIPSYARVRNPSNGREVIVRINDRGPFHDGRVIDLSYTAALKLGVLNGVAPVEVERITQEAIRTGAWRNGADGRAVAAAPAANPATISSPAPAPAAAAPAAASTVVASVSALGVTPPEPPAGALTTVAIGSTPPRALETETGPGEGTDDPIEPVRSARPIAQAGSGYWLQLGAFRERDGAFDFQRKVERELDWLAPLMAVFVDRDLHRLQAGPYPSRSEAYGAAERLRAELHLVPLVVERR
jgi:rare lipoprotein A